MSRDRVAHTCCPFCLRLSIKAVQLLKVSSLLYTGWLQHVLLPLQLRYDQLLGVTIFVPNSKPAEQPRGGFQGGNMVNFLIAKLLQKQHSWETLLRVGCCLTPKLHLVNECASEQQQVCSCLSAPDGFACTKDFL